MMNIDIQYEVRKQRYEFLLREAEERRLARELGFTDLIILRLVVTELWKWLSRTVTTKVTKAEQSLISREQHSAQAQSAQNNS